MSYVEVTLDKETVVLELRIGKVNSLDGEVVNELRSHLDEYARNPDVRAMVLTGRGKFFSFGLDVPELYPLSKDEFTDFVRQFTDLYTHLFVYPKPVVAALNGHAIAGGCMLALACDRRLMAAGKGKIGLNEVTFGSSVFAGSAEMLRACVGERTAERILFSGTMFGVDEALDLGLIDRVVPPENLLSLALEEAHEMAGVDGAALTAIKQLLRGPIADSMRLREDKSIAEFVRIWYSENTRRQLKGIEIRKD